jgi:integrase
MPRRKADRRLEGIEVRHQDHCPAPEGECSCRPTYRASVWDPRDRRLIRQRFSTLAAAKGWRVDALAAVRRGELRGDLGPTLREAADSWVKGAEAGSIRNRSGDRYKPSAVRGYEQALRLRLVPELGGVRLGDLRRADVQALVDRLLRDSHEPATIRNTLLPLRAICRRAIARGEIAINPTTGLELPAVRGRRDRIASPPEAEQLLDALQRDRALWATAFYAGLRLGELQALDWSAVDLEQAVIRVQASWDPRAGLVAPKSAAGRRVVPIASVLLRHLRELQIIGAGGFVFGRADGRTFAPSSVVLRAETAWEAEKLEPIGLHECRHTFASFMIAAGVNAKALSTYMGHASVTIRFDRYGHLMPGNEAEAARLLDRYLSAQGKRSRRSKAA